MWMFLALLYRGGLRLSHWLSAGIDGLAVALGSDCANGIGDTATLEMRKKEFGENKFATPPLATYWELFIATFEVLSDSFASLSALF